MVFNDQDEGPVKFSNVDYFFLKDLVKDLQIDVIIKMYDAIPKLDHRNVSIPLRCIEKAVLHQNIDDFSAGARGP